MCSSKCKLKQQESTSINGRPVLHPNCNRIPLLERRNSVIKANGTTSPSNSTTKTVAKPNNSVATTPPASPSGKLKSPRLPAIKRSSNDQSPINAVSNSTTLKSPSTNCKSLTLKKSKKSTDQFSTLKYSSSVIVESPGSIAAARREQVANLQEQRRMRIAHYGRTTNSKSKLLPIDNNTDNDQSTNNVDSVQQLEKRCSFITPNSDPIYVAYHDEEWGVPVHDDKLLFELLVLTGAQVGSDWTSVLRKRQDFRDAFSGFDAEIVSKYSEKKMSSISNDYGIELSQVRGVVDNSKRILEMKKEFGSFEKYLWGFLNHKPIETQYKWCHKIPVKTSKSESISKDMVRRGFRLVGPTVIYSFMQAAGLTNDHLVTCPRHSQCLSN
ncbi:hypothetical protein ACJIZ3_008570 [Penstemon smallii]|uniref:DNA-3-methyladenine glycosylase I n=1 Tax=Penstemon smallii TaxID=265156 RepID=A0ABD3TA69_9LAMI